MAQEQASANLNQFFKNLFELKQFIKSKCEESTQIHSDMNTVYEKLDSFFKDPIEHEEEAKSA